MTVIECKRDDWSEQLYTADGGYNLPRTYTLDFAVAIYLYTCEDPSVYKAVNKAMFNPERRENQAASGQPKGALARLGGRDAHALQPPRASRLRARRGRRGLRGARLQDVANIVQHDELRRLRPDFERWRRRDWRRRRRWWGSRRPHHH